MKKRLLFTTAALLSLGGSALAADVTGPAYDWSGFYLGVFGQYVTGNADAQVVGGPFDSFDIDGFQFGGLAGYNYQMDSVVLGLEGDVGFLAVDGVGFGGGLDDLDFEPVSHIRGRVGYALDNVMPFIAGGLSLGDGDARVPGFGAPSELHVGWNIGAGIDVGLTDNLVVRGEYIFDSYSTETYRYAPGNIDIGADTSTFRLAAIWKL